MNDSVDLALPADSAGSTFSDVIAIRAIRINLFRIILLLLMYALR